MDGVFSWIENALSDVDYYLEGVTDVFSGVTGVWDRFEQYFGGGSNGSNRGGGTTQIGSIAMTPIMWIIAGVVVLVLLFKK